MTPTNRLSEHWETSINHWLAKKHFSKTKTWQETQKNTVILLMVQKSCKTIGSLSHPIIFTRFFTSIQTVVGLGGSEPSKLASTSSYETRRRDSGPKDAQPPRILLLGSRQPFGKWEICLQDKKFIQNAWYTSLKICLKMLDDIMYCPDKNCQWMQQSSNFNQSSQLAGESPSRSAKVATNHLPKLYMSHARGCCRNLWTP